MKIIYLPQAENSLDDIFEYIKHNSEKSAVNVYNNIIDEIDRLVIFPNIGQAYHSIIGIRTLVVVKNYKVVYIVDNEVIYIILVWDCRQDPLDLKKKVLNSLK